MEMSPKVWAITSVGVGIKFRRQGHASRLLQEVVNDADRETVVLILQVEPDPHDGTNRTAEELKGWYRRVGFERWRDEDSMIRFPAEGES